MNKIKIYSTVNNDKDHVHIGTVIKFILQKREDSLCNEFPERTIELTRKFYEIIAQEEIFKFL